MSFYLLRVAGFEPVMVEREPDNAQDRPRSIGRSDAVRGTRSSNQPDAERAASAAMELFPKLMRHFDLQIAGRTPQGGRLNPDEPKRKAPENRSPGLGHSTIE